MRHFAAFSLLASLTFAASSAEAATGAHKVFEDACKSIKAQSTDAGPQAVRAKPTVLAIMQIAGSSDDCAANMTAAAGLKTLDLSGKGIEDITVLGMMANLTELNISNNKVTASHTVEADVDSAPTPPPATETNQRAFNLKLPFNPIVKC